MVCSLPQHLCSLVRHSTTSLNNTYLLEQVWVLGAVVVQPRHQLLPCMLHEVARNGEVADGLVRGLTQIQGALISEEGRGPQAT